MTAQPLKGLRVLITRPAHQAAGLLLRLEDAGAVVDTLPLLAIAPPSDPTTARAALRQGLDADLWIFTSANAVTGAHSLHEANWPAALLALGQGTVRALATIGHAAVGPEGGSSEDLLLWPELADLSGKRVLIITGEGGRTLLADTLRRRGAIVSLACCYQRQRVVHTPARVTAALAAADVAVITSGEALQALLTLATPDLLPALPLLLPSLRVAALARQAGCKAAILLPDAMSDAAMTRRLEQWQRAPHNDCP